MADNFLAFLDLAEKVSLAGDFSVFSMALRQPLLQNKELL